MPNPRRLPVALALLTGAALVAGCPGLAAAARGASPLTIAPPAGALASTQRVTPFQSPGSPYLHVTARSYRTPLGPEAVYRYYLPRLAALGYKSDGSGTSYGPSGVTSRDWAFARGTGQDDTALLTVVPVGTGSRYSLARDLIIPPARPRASLVPDAATSVVVTARSSAGAKPLERTVTGGAELRELLARVDALGMDARGVHGCAMDVGATATLRFAAGGRSYVFTEDPACLSVTGPGGTKLEDGGYRLWRTVVALLGIRSAYGS